MTLASKLIEIGSRLLTRLCEILAGLANFLGSDFVAMLPSPNRDAYKRVKLGIREVIQPQLNVNPTYLDHREMAAHRPESAGRAMYIIDGGNTAGANVNGLHSSERFGGWRQAYSQAPTRLSFLECH
jgi:hypothetical protein